jgi:chemotaxis protein MotB
MSENEGVSTLIQDESSEQPGWILTFADLVTLLLVFFILLFSISAMNVEKFKAAMMSIQTNLGESTPAIGLEDIIDTPQTVTNKVSLEDLIGLNSREKSMIKEIRNFIKEKELGENIVVNLFQGKVNIRVQGTILFESGAAQLNEEAYPILDDIIRILSKYIEYNINIKGHTDNVPIHSTRFPSNWELSAIRSTTVLQYLISSGIDPSRLTATGYGELLPLVPNDSEENRAMNRRVEFVLEKETG